MSELLDLDVMEREYQHCNDTREAGCYHFHCRVFKAIAELRDLRGVRREAQRLEEDNDDRRHEMVALAKRVEELTKQRDSAFDTANTARALLSRVEELEGLLRAFHLDGDNSESYRAVLREAERLARSAS